MRITLFLVALLMLVYLMASFFGSGYIGIVYAAALGASATGKISFQGAYDMGVAVYAVIMIAAFGLSFRSGK
jgi:hypothetical protein